MKILGAGMEETQEEFKTQSEIMSKKSTQIEKKYKSVKKNYILAFGDQLTTDKLNECEPRVLSIESKLTPSTHDEIKAYNKIFKQK